ncbi:MAG: YbaB/EbfC family nucleoid-associated protein [Candidatus Kerfeldbacteria bacterium]|nr:YbaB/EbfC family nucleoid-associated protein [Candidatus Kerfeldbacteria bacterium]
MFEKLKQYKDMRDQAKMIQNKLKDVVVHADADHGKIQVVMDGNQQVVGIEIDPDHLRQENREQLQKHIAEAVNSAVRKSQIEMAKNLKGMDGLNIPGLGK